MKKRLLALILALMLLLSGCGGDIDEYAEYIQYAAYMGQEIAEYYAEQQEQPDVVEVEDYSVNLADIPEYSGDPYIVIGDNVPFFYFFRFIVCISE